MSLTESKISILEQKAKEIRQSVIDMLREAGSGHTAGSLDIIDILVCLYFNNLLHDPKNPNWEYRDHIVLSNGHTCPGFYATLAHAGYFKIEELKTLRKFGSRLQGHPDRNFLPLIETSSGPLGSGLSQAVGMALADKIDYGNTANRKVYCIMSDGELDEGNTWEAIMLAGKEKLHNLIAIIDRNNIQLGGMTDEIMPLSPLADKWKAFNWQTIEIDGHNFQEINRALEVAKMNSGKPTVIIAKTIASKGIPEYEGKYEWHGKAPPKDNQPVQANSDLVSTREGFGQGLVLAGAHNSNVVALSADLSESTGMLPFKNKYPDRYIEVGVAEQNLVTVASGLAHMGKIPFVGSYAIFSPGRNWEQIRTTICLNNVPVKIIGSHGGLNVGEDGGSHQMLEDIALMRSLPRMTVICPCDAIEAKKATLAVSKTKDPSYIRLSRFKSPILTKESDSFVIGKADIVFNNLESNPHKKKVIDPKDKKTVGMIVTGTMLSYVLNTAKRLEKEGYKVAVMKLSTIKPLDEEAIIKLAHETRALVTVEDHSILGGMGSAVAECLSSNFPVPIEFIGVKDQFGQSGKPEELFKHYGLGEEDIYKAVHRVIVRKS